MGEDGTTEATEVKSRTVTSNPGTVERTSNFESKNKKFPCEEPSSTKLGREAYALQTTVYYQGGGTYHYHTVHSARTAASRLWRHNEISRDTATDTESNSFTDTESHSYTESDAHANSDADTYTLKCAGLVSGDDVQ